MRPAYVSSLASESSYIPLADRGKEAA
jgi:hypothetical protein